MRSWTFFSFSNRISSFSIRSSSFSLRSCSRSCFKVATRASNVATFSSRDLFSLPVFFNFSYSFFSSFNCTWSSRRRFTSDVCGKLWNYEISVPNYNNVHRKKCSIGSKYAFVFNTVKCRYCYWELITCSTQCLYESHTDYLCLMSMGQYWWDMTSWIKHGSYDSSILTHQYNNFHRQHCCSSVLVPTLTSSFCCNSMIFFSRPFATDLIWSTERASICSQSLWVNHVTTFNDIEGFAHNYHPSHVLVMEVQQFCTKLRM